MNAAAMQRSVISEFIFGDKLLHARFAMAIELLTRIVIATPRPVTTAVLSQALGQPPCTVRALLIDLHKSGLIRRDDNAGDVWYGAAALGTITLADVFCSVSLAAPEHAGKKKGGARADEVRSAAQQCVDLLLMQASMAINQVVLQHLQAFDLGRLKALASSGSFRPFTSEVRPYTVEPL